MVKVEKIISLGVVHERLLSVGIVLGWDLASAVVADARARSFGVDGLKFEHKFPLLSLLGKSWSRR